MKLKYIFCLAGVILFCSSCFDDKGNYKYSPINELTIEVQDEVPVLANADTIKVYPKIISNLEGEILADNLNYVYTYKAALQIGPNREEALFVLDSAFSKNLVIPAKLSPGNYKCWLEVKDVRTDVITTAEFIIKVSSATTEGWMVLCDEGAENRVRLDMIARISSDRSVQTFDILANYLPDLHGAYALEFFSDSYGFDDYLYLLSETGCYRLESESLISGPEYNMNYEFARQDEHHSATCMKITSGYRLIVDQNHNGYAMENDMGAIYELPVNTELSGMAPQFKLAPFMGTDLKNAGNKCVSAILYDTDNRRFMQWTESALDVCFPMTDPENALFSYQTGKELVYMQSTYNSGTVVYAILKDSDGKYYLSGISMGFSWISTIYRQQYYEEIKATDFDKATVFAFHSKLPYLFYAVGNQLYQYDIYQKKVFPMFSFPDENITLLKFNLFVKDHRYSPNEFKSIPEHLIVGTENLNVENENRGVLRFYEVPPLNAVPVLIGEPYRGFGKIRDVVYRERD